MSLAAGTRSLYSITSAAASRRVPRISAPNPPERRVPRKTAAMNSCEKSTAGIGCRPACAFHSASHSARDRTTTSEASLIPLYAPCATVVTGGAALWRNGYDEDRDQASCCQVNDSPPSRHRASLMRKPARDQTKVGRSAVLRAVGRCKSGKCQVTQHGHRKWRCPCRHKLHTFWYSTVRHSPTPCRCIGRKILQAGGATAGGELATIARA